MVNICQCREDDDEPYICDDCSAFYKEREEQIARNMAVVETVYQENLWGPNGLLWDPNDPICQEVLTRLKLST